MTKIVTGSIPNLVNGISQQAPALRLATQGEVQENYYSTIVEGLKDRPPSEFVAKLLDSLPDGVFTHIIHRDRAERYVLVSDGTMVRVWDFDGNEVTVNAPEGYAYLAGTTVPAADLAALTVADYTFVCNRKKVTAMAATPLSPVRGKEALVNVLAGNYGKTYSILINGGTAGYYQAPDGDQASESTGVDTVYIATQLVAALTNRGFNDGTVWRSTRYGNAIHIERLDGGDFDIKAEDGYNGNAMKAVKERVQKFADLPSFGPDGFIAEITGDSGNQWEKYWVRFETGTAGPGIWRECPKPGLKLRLDGATMPHTLVREADGSFTFMSQTWDDRVCGDEEISPEPSFAGRSIADIFFHRNRLGFLCDENAVMSRNGSFFNFFRTTATAVLDDDPIDIGASHIKVSLLKHAVPFQDDLLLFSEQTQFKLAGNEMLTPKTVSIKPLTEYANDPEAKPLTLGTSVFFTAKRGAWEAMWEYMIDKQSATPTADEVTAHVPAYIPAGVYQIVGASNENIVVALTTGDPSALYVYRYYWSANQKLQAAWQRWRLAGSPHILNAQFVESDLYVVTRRPDGVFLERLRVQPNAFDEGLGFLVLLDQRVHTDKLPAPLYDAGTRTTTYTLPYAPAPDILAVTSPGGAGLAAVSLKVVGVNAAARTVTLSGDTQGSKMWFGRNYERRYRFSRFFLRQPSANGGSTTIQSGRLQLAQMTLSYNKCAYFRVEITPLGRQTYVQEVTGRSLGDALNVPGTVPLLTGKKTFALMSRNDRVTIDIVNDSWMPCSFINVEWVGRHSERVREL